MPPRPCPRSPEARRPRDPRSPRGHVIGTHGLPVLAALLFLVFSVVLPDTFPTRDNVSSILSNQAVPALLALGATIPIATGKFDLSIGYGLGLAHVLVMHLIVEEGTPWPLAALAVVLGGALVGAVNGAVVEFARIDSFIATLGTGSIMYALTGWLTDGSRIVPGPEGLPAAFTSLYDARFLGLPVPAFYVLATVVVLWVVLERLPFGRYLYVVGSNPRAADIIGIPTHRYSVYAFAGSGLVVGIAGVLLAAQQQIGNPSVGLDYLLPAFVGALLGSTTIKPGRANALGTLVAVSVLAIGLAGIGQLGAQFWATPLFNGAPCCWWSAWPATRPGDGCAPGPRRTPTRPTNLPGPRRRGRTKPDRTTYAGQEHRVPESHQCPRGRGPVGGRHHPRRGLRRRLVAGL